MSEKQEFKEAFLAVGAAFSGVDSEDRTTAYGANLDYIRENFGYDITEEQLMLLDKASGLDILYPEGNVTIMTKDRDRAERMGSLSHDAMELYGGDFEAFADVLNDDVFDIFGVDLSKIGDASIDTASDTEEAAWYAVLAPYGQKSMNGVETPECTALEVDSFVGRSVSDAMPLMVPDVFETRHPEEVDSAVYRMVDDEILGYAEVVMGIVDRHHDGKVYEFVDEFDQNYREKLREEGVPVTD